MKVEKRDWKRYALGLLASLFSSAATPACAASLTLTNPILFVTQAPIPKEINGTVSNTFVSVVSLFGNHLADTAHAARGGDLWLMTTNLGLVNLTRKAGLGTSGSQDGVGIGVRDPSIHWSGKKAIFSMVVGAPTGSNDLTQFYWQLYEITNLDSVVLDTNTTPDIRLVQNQPLNFNNVNPCYATDGRIIFTTDKPFNGAMHLYPSLEEYKGNPSVSGTWSLDPGTGDLRLLNHTPSGAFNPIVDSFGRIIETRWDHLVQDANATDDRLNLTTNGSFDFLFETNNSAFQSTNIVENFPEPRNFDGVGLGQSKTRGNSFNNFLPWMLPEAGGAEEVLNHVGRHELLQTMLNTFTNDANLLSFSNLASRALCGVVSANTNFIANFFQPVEDPRNPGTYFGVDAPDFSPAGGTHTAGRIVALAGPPTLNPTGMVVLNITSTNVGNLNTPLAYRNPLPMTDGKLLAAVTPATNWDINLGTETLPKPFYQFRLMLLTNSGPGAFYSTNRYLITNGISNSVSYWAGGVRVTNNNLFWELQPVEIRSRTNPAPWVTGVAPIEQQVFAAESVDLPTFQTDLAQRGLALVVSRNVTARDAADKQQPYNLHVTGGTNSVANGGKIYDITHLQFLQADYLRGYNFGAANPTPGRRVLAAPLHDTTAFNYSSSQASPPLGGTELMPDGSQATIVPANRAMTWQLTGTNGNESIVKERYWITFRPGEVRTCANCHGINDKDQLGRPAPANPPQALQKLLRLWRTNAVNAYSLTVSNGLGGGSFGAGAIVPVSAAPPPSGKVFSQWSGAGISNAFAPTTFFTMPASSTTVAAVYATLPQPAITGWQPNGGGSFTLNAQAYPNQPWVLQASTNLVNWSNLSTNISTPLGTLSINIPVSPAVPQQFFRFASQ